VANRTYTLARAQALLPVARSRALEGVELVRELNQLVGHMQAGNAPPDIQTEIAALEAAVDAVLLWFDEHGVQIKSLDPVLLDFPARAIRDGEPLDVLLCWREDEDTIAFYHPVDTGYRMREPVAFLDDV
jgi:hypothetical protein